MDRFTCGSAFADSRASFQARTRRVLFPRTCRCSPVPGRYLQAALGPDDEVDQVMMLSCLRRAPVPSNVFCSSQRRTVSRIVAAKPSRRPQFFYYQAEARVRLRPARRRAALCAVCISFRAPENLELGRSSRRACCRRRLPPLDKWFPAHRLPGPGEKRNESPSRCAPFLDNLVRAGTPLCRFDCSRRHLKYPL